MTNAESNVVPPTSKLKVLVVDDSQTIRTSAASILSDDFELMTAEDGLDALSKVGKFHPDIIFIDIVMPRLGGYETVSLLRSNPEFSMLPIIMMSSKSGTFDIAKGRLIGCDSYVVKPFDRDTLLKSLNDAMALRSGAHLAG